MSINEIITEVGKIIKERFWEKKWKTRLRARKNIKIQEKRKKKAFDYEKSKTQEKERKHALDQAIDQEKCKF